MLRRFAVVSAPSAICLADSFDRANEAEAFLLTMERIWSGPGKVVMQNPARASSMSSKPRMCDVARERDERFDSFT